MLIKKFASKYPGQAFGLAKLLLEVWKPSGDDNAIALNENRIRSRKTGGLLSSVFGAALGAGAAISSEEDELFGGVVGGVLGGAQAMLCHLKRLNKHNG